MTRSPAAIPGDLYAFGSKTCPRGPRLGIDLFPDGAGMIGPEAPPAPAGASVFGDPMASPLCGHYHRLAAGVLLPEGLEVAADGVDIHPNSLHAPTHHTIFPGVRMQAVQFVQLFLSLPWQYAGRKS